MKDEERRKIKSNPGMKIRKLRGWCARFLLSPRQNDVTTDTTVILGVEMKIRKLRGRCARLPAGEGDVHPWDGNAENPKKWEGTQVNRVRAHDGCGPGNRPLPPAVKAGMRL